jgi:hypothetical protein
VRVPPGVHRGPGGTDGGAERVGQVLHHGEVLRGPDTAAAGDHDRGLGELGAVTLLLLDPVGDPGGLGGVGQLDLDGFSPRRHQPDGSAGDGVGPHGDHGNAPVTFAWVMIAPPKMECSPPPARS